MDIRTERILIAFSKSGLRQIDVCNMTGISKSLYLGLYKIICVWEN